MTVPVVVNTIPADQAIDVVITTRLQVIFNTPIDPDSVNIGNSFLFRVDTGDAIDGKLRVEGNIIHFLPAKALYEGVSYSFSVFGKATGGVSGNIKSITGDDLVDTYTFTFTSEIKKYATLDEVEERADVTVDGPIRVADIMKAGGLKLQAVSPLGFTSQLSPSLDKVTFTFSEDIDASTLTGNISMETFDVLGDEGQYGAPAVSDGKIYLQEWEPGTGECDFSQPTGEFLASGNQITWERGTGEPDFNYNTELEFVITQSLKDTNGHFLIEEHHIRMSTELFPKYADSRMLRVDCGPMIADQLDDTINIMIHRNSLEAWYIAAHCFDIWEPYPSVKQFARYMTIVDLFDMISSHAQVVMGQKQILGDLEVQYPVKVDSTLRAKASKKRDELEKKMIKLRRQNVPVVAIKGALAGDQDLGNRARRWDIEYQYGGRFFDPTTLMVPASNMVRMRLQKLAAAHDASPNVNYLASRYYYGTTGQGTGLFVIPTPGN